MIFLFLFCIFMLISFAAAYIVAADNHAPDSMGIIEWIALPAALLIMLVLTIWDSSFNRENR